MLKNEKLLPVPKAVELETGYRPHPATSWRWGKKKRLEVVYIGNRMLTSQEAVRRMIEAETAARQQEQPEFEPVDDRPSPRAKAAAVTLRKRLAGSKK